MKKCATSETGCSELSQREAFGVHRPILTFFLKAPIQLIVVYKTFQAITAQGSAHDGLSENMSRILAGSRPKAYSQEIVQIHQNLLGEAAMLWTIAVILIVLWLLGLISGYTISGFIHVLLVIAVVVVLVRIIQGRRPL
jgi:hypothetical protein